MRCCWCKKSIQLENDHAILNAVSGSCTKCGHLSCFQCLSENLATTLPTQWISCPICMRSISSHTVAPALTKVVEHRDPVVRDVHQNPSKEKDPLRHFMKHESNPSGKTMVFFAHVGTDGKQGRTATSIINKNGEFKNKHSRDVLVSWARYLGRAFYGKGQGAETPETYQDNVESLMEFALRQCQNPGFRFIYNFANGESLDDTIRLKTEPSSPRASNLFASFAAHSILQQTDSNQKNNVRSVSLLQKAIGDLLYTYGCSKPVVDTLSRFRISASLSHIQRLASQENVKHLEELCPPDVFELLVYCNDNLDFKKKKNGRNKDEGMENWVVQTVKHVAKDDPILAPCYDGKLSMKKKTLDSILDECKDKDEDPYATIFGIRDIDYRRLTFYTHRHIEYSICHPFCHVDDLGPLTEQANPNLKRKQPPLRNLGIDVRAQKKWDAHGKRIPFKLRAFDPQSPPGDYEFIDRKRQNLLARNALTVDIPVKLPMSEKETIRAFLDQYLETRKLQMKDIGEDEAAMPDPVPLASKYILYIGDGQPVYLAYKMKDEMHHQNDDRYKPISVFPGAFHYLKEVIGQGSKLMQAFRRDTISKYRPTAQDQDHVLFPDDPRQFEDEAVSYLSAMYRSAIEEYAMATQKTVLSASEVYNYMVEAAGKKWFAQLTLDDILLHEIYMMIRDAIKANESELFFSAVRLSLPLFAATNATNYTRIAFELLLWRETASEEELYLFEAFAFTRFTEYGEFQAVDMCQEKVNKKFKEKLPQKAVKGFETKIKNRAVELNQEANGKIKGRATKERNVLLFNEKAAEDGWENVYSTVRRDMHLKQVWKWDGKVQFLEKRRNGSMKAVREDVVMGPNWGLMSNEIMVWFHKGIDRCKEYCESFYTCEEKFRHQVERRVVYKKGGVPLTLVMSTEEAYEQRAKKRSKLALSVNKEEINKVARSKDNIRAAIKHTRRYLTKKPPEKPDLDTMNELSAELVSLRKKWIAEEVSRKNCNRKRLISELEGEERRKGAKTSEAKRNEVIRGDKSGFFYTGHPIVKSDFCVGKQLNQF